MTPRNRGYSLMEVLVTLLITSVITAGAFGVVRSMYSSQQTILGQNAATSSARSAIDEAMDRIRGAQLISSTGPITLAAANEIQFNDYYDQYDSTQAHTAVTVRYWLSGGRLTRTVSSGGASVTTTAAAGVQSIQFYYRVTGSTAWVTSTGTPANVVAVSCTATASVMGASRQITGTVQIRQKGAG